MDDSIKPIKYQVLINEVMLIYVYFYESNYNQIQHP
jgi:hypothetical protein